MKDISEVNQACTGCGACLVRCPAKCIRMEKNGEGFYYPVINQSSCIHCGRCYTGCPAAGLTREKESLYSFGALSKWRKETERSSSGGAFFTFAKAVVDHGGIVFGARMSENCEVEISSADKEEGLWAFQGSKYVQARAEQAYMQAETCLKQGKRVLFAGTPCQIAGLYACVGDPDNLITMDVICHGVPSPGFFSEYIRKIETTAGKAAEKICFRYKDERYRTSFTLRISEKDKVWHEVYHKRDAYYSLFMNGASYRESCYRCRYAKEKRIGDITIGDLGTYKEYPRFYPEKATSVVLINTAKGMDLWNDTKKDFEYIPISFERETVRNHQLKAPVKRPEIRDWVYRDFKEMTFAGFCRKYRGRLSLREGLSLGIKKHLPGFVFRLGYKRREKDI